MRSLYPKDLQKAIEFASQKHKGQKRKSGKDYITHPLSVLSILQDHGFEKDILVTAVLHDVLEDTDSTLAEIRNLFGDRTCFMVSGLSKLKKRHTGQKEASPYRPAYKSTRFMIYLKQFSDSAWVETGILAVKMADQIDNLTDIAAISPENHTKKKQQVRNCFLPLYRDMMDKKTLRPAEQQAYRSLLATLEGLA